MIRLLFILAIETILVKIPQFWDGVVVEAGFVMVGFCKAAKSRRNNRLEYLMINAQPSAFWNIWIVCKAIARRFTHEYALF